VMPVADGSERKPFGHLQPFKHKDWPIGKRSQTTRMPLQGFFIGKGVCRQSEQALYEDVKMLCLLPDF
jgi:hypothetical protein